MRVLAAIFALVLCAVPPSGSIAVPAMTAPPANAAGKAPPATQDAAPADVSGTWQLRIVTGRTTIDGTLQIEQDGSTIRGTWTRADITDSSPAPISGEVHAETLTFAARAAIPADADVGQVEFVGAIEEGLLAGTFTTESGVGGEWTARRPMGPVVAGSWMMRGRAG